MTDLINTIIEFLELKVKYSIKLQHSIRSGSRAEYMSEHSDSDKLVKHCIKIAMKGIEYDVRNLETLIAHEFVHAWQAENKPNSASHGKSFIIMADKLQEFLRDEGYSNIGNIYLKDIDERN